MANRISLLQKKKYPAVKGGTAINTQSSRLKSDPMCILAILQSFSALPIDKPAQTMYNKNARYRFCGAEIKNLRSSFCESRIRPRQRAIGDAA